MKWLIPALALPLVFGCATEAIDQAVEVAERARATAIAGQDGDAYRRLVADDLRVVDPRGELVTRDDRISAIESGTARITRRGEETLEVRRYGDIALVMGESVWQRDGRENHDYFTRIWVWRRNQWKMVGAHYSDITAAVASERPWFTRPAHAVQALPIASTPAPGSAEEEVRRVIGDQHRAYWSKDEARYRQYASPDLLRIAENGVRTQEELIAGMRGNARLPAPPPEHLDVRVRVYGNVAVTGWLDQGTDAVGRPTPNRFTVVFVRRDAGWQMVHIQSTGLQGR